jgi:hypothetical protein
MDFMSALRPVIQSDAPKFGAKHRRERWGPRCRCRCVRGIGAETCSFTGQRPYLAPDIKFGDRFSSLDSCWYSLEYISFGSRTPPPGYSHQYGRSQLPRKAPANLRRPSFSKHPSSFPASVELLRQCTFPSPLQSSNTSHTSMNELLNRRAKVQIWQRRASGTPIEDYPQYCQVNTCMP